MRIRLLREVVQLLMSELDAISNRKWEALPDLKKRKESLANQLRRFDWTPGTPEQESLDLIMLKSQISDLEYQSRQKIQVQMQIIKTQIASLQDQQRGWLDCLNSYSKKCS